MTKSELTQHTNRTSLAESSYYFILFSASLNHLNQVKSRHLKTKIISNHQVK